jgi:lipopolysaccharide transport system ATP-binding protein
VAGHPAIQEDGKEFCRSGLIGIIRLIMSNIVVVAENVSKRYLVGHQSVQRERYTTLRDVVGREARNFARKAVDFVRGRQIVQGDEVEEFWALKDVSFEVKQGEVLGIIGRNGAGKSTLLKILSFITEPTRGRTILRGRVASLLEVGTGFHPELTGRENIFLNGAILGMTRAEIARKFDEIVDFADVERFLDIPIKHYSNGMYVRLAFAVAAHLEPEILIVDEVLAVGDLEFQKKCLGKMQDVASTQGRTILFVSHNMAAVESLCGSALLLDKGRCVVQGDTPAVVQKYLRDMSRATETSLNERTDRTGSGHVRFLSVLLEDNSGSSVSAFQCGAEAVLNLGMENTTKDKLRNVRVALGIEDEMGQCITVLDTMLVGADNLNLPPGRGSVRVTVLKMALIPGRYRLILWSSVSDVVADWIKNAATFDVEAGDFYGTGRLPPHREGMFLLEHSFIVGDTPATSRQVKPKRGVPSRGLAG